MLLRATLSCLALLAPLAVQAGTYDADPVHSSVAFEVTHMVISKVRGEFERFVGIAEIEEGVLQRVRAAVQIDSVDTGDVKRDMHLLSADFFDAETHPGMTFQSTAITPNGGGFTMVGDLTIRGITQSVTFAVEPLNGPVRDLSKRERYGTRATATINRKAFGIHWNQALDEGGLVVGEEVTIILDMALVDNAS